MRGTRSVTVLVFALLVANAAPAQAGSGGELRASVAREWASFRSIWKSPARIARVVATSAVGIGTGFAIKSVTGSPAQAALGAYVAGTIVDRVIDRFSPRTRPSGWKRPTLLRDVVQSSVGATVAALGSPLALHVVQPLAQLGDSAPGVIGMAARLLPSRQFLQLATGAAVSLVAGSARAAAGYLFPHRKARARR